MQNLKPGAFTNFKIFKGIAHYMNTEQLDKKEFLQDYKLIYCARYLLADILVTPL